MRKVKVVNTSTGCLDFYQGKHDVEILRIKMQLGDKTVIDGDTIKADEFYALMRSDRTLVPKTSQPSPNDVVEYLQTFVDQGYDEIFVCSISGELSGTVNSIRLAADLLADKIKVTAYDTKTVCFNEGFMALEADRLFKEGKTTNEVINYLENLKTRNTIFFAVDDLTQLVNNGRLSGAKAFFGKLLKIKPILQVEGSGKIVAVDKHRNVKKALTLITDNIKTFVDGRSYTANILYAGNPTLKGYFLEILEKELGLVNLYEAPATPVVGAHIGGDVVGIGIFVDE